MKLDDVPLPIEALYDLILEEIEVNIKKIDFDKTKQLADLIVDKHKNRIFLAGKGRSGLISKTFAMRLLHLGFNVSVIGEITTPPIKKDDLCIISSGSGSYVIDKGNKNFELIGITANKDSKLANNADLSIILSADTKTRDKLSVIEQFVSVQPMGSLFEQLLFFFLEGIVLYLMIRMSVFGTEMFSRHANIE